MKRYKPDGMLIRNGNSFLAMPVMNVDNRGEYVKYSDVKELESKADKEDLELAAAIRWAISYGAMKEIFVKCNKTELKELVKIYREHKRVMKLLEEQKRGAE